MYAFIAQFDFKINVTRFKSEEHMHQQHTPNMAAGHLQYIFYVYFKH